MGAPGRRYRGDSAQSRTRVDLVLDLCGLGMGWQGDLMWYRAGADLVMVVHLLVIGFIVGGVFLT